MPSNDGRDRYVLVGAIVLALLALVYGVLIARDVLTWIGIAIPFVALYLFWRLVRAHERLADAME